MAEPLATPQMVHVVVNPTRCDGGKYACAAEAVYAYRLDGDTTWLYACGRHLTYGLTEASDGEQAQYNVQRIRTEK